MPTFSPGKSLRISCLGAMLSQAAPVLAEPTAPSRVTPLTIVPPIRQDQSDTIERRSTPVVSAPENAEKLFVTVKSVAVRDGYPGLDAAVRTEAVRVEGRRVSVRDLYDLSARIEALYAARGYFLARAIVPAQKIEDGGSFTVQIVRGFIETVEINGLNSRTRKLVDYRLKGLVGVGDITLAQVERHMLLAGDIPGLSLASALERGEKPGGVRLIVQGRLKPATVTFGADNAVADGFYGVQFSAQASLSNVLGRGELIYASVFNGPDLDELVSGNPTRRVFGLGAVLPLGNDGLSLTPEYIVAQIHPREQPGVLVTTGHFSRASLKLAYPAIRSRSRNLVVTGMIEAVAERQVADQFATVLSKDRLHIASVAVDWAGQLQNSASFTSRLALTRGLLGFGARLASDVAATGIGFSRAGSQPDYAKVSADVRLRSVSGGGADFTLTARGQKSLTGALPSYGQISLDGGDGLSAFAPGSLNVDSGMTLRGEIGRRLVRSKFDLAPYLFGAIGFGELARPTALEKANVHGGSFGAGVRSTLYRLKSGAVVQGALEFAHGESNTIRQGGNRLSFAISLRF